MSDRSSQPAGGRRQRGVGGLPRDSRLWLTFLSGQANFRVNEDELSAPPCPTVDPVPPVRLPCPGVTLCDRVPAYDLPWRRWKTARRRRRRAFSTPAWRAGGLSAT